MNEKIQLDLINTSPYDNSFPAMLLTQAFDFRVEQSNEIVNKIYEDVVNKSSAPLSMERGEEKLKLVVDASEDFMDEYKDGTIKLVQENGVMRAQLRENGHYGKKLSIKEESYIEGPGQLEISNALQLKAIQDSLAIISEQIKYIDRNVKEVITGQQNDRFALYYSGVALYLEAASVSEQELKKELITQAIKALTEASFKLTLKLQSDIIYLRNKEYDLDKKNKSNLMNEKIGDINNGFAVIHQAAILKAGIYCEAGEMRAVANVLNEYGRFIEGTISKNAYMLSQCDNSDSGKSDGIWKGRAQLQLDVRNVVAAINAPKKVLYIENKGENDESI